MKLVRFQCTSRTGVFSEARLNSRGWSPYLFSFVFGKSCSPRLVLYMCDTGLILKGFHHQLSLSLSNGKPLATVILRRKVAPTKISITEKPILYLELGEKKEKPTENN